MDAGKVRTTYNSTVYVLHTQQKMHAQSRVCSLNYLWCPSQSSGPRVHGHSVAAF